MHWCVESILGQRGTHTDCFSIAFHIQHQFLSWFLLSGSRTSFLNFFPAIKKIDIKWKSTLVWPYRDVEVPSFIHTRALLHPIHLKWRAKIKTYLFMMLLKKENKKKKKNIWCNCTIIRHFASLSTLTIRTCLWVGFYSWLDWVNVMWAKLNGKKCLPESCGCQIMRQKDACCRNQMRFVVWAPIRDSTDLLLFKGAF